jgi:hypothetical protein
MADEAQASNPPKTDTAPQTPQQATPPRQTVLDISGLSTYTANWFQVTGTPEELILDFAVSLEHIQTPTQPIKLSHRLVLSPYTAKRLLNGLQMALSRYESTFGLIEMNPNNRVRSGPVMPTPQRP